jgi:hypothetical protein
MAEDMLCKIKKAGIHGVKEANVVFCDLPLRDCLSLMDQLVAANNSAFQNLILR